MILDIFEWGLPISDYMFAFIVLILIIRRPVAKYFGAEAVFLLWSIPVVRLLMPHLHLPVKNDIMIFNFNPFTVEQMKFGFGYPSNVNDRLGSTVDTTSQYDVVSILAFIWITVGILWLSYHLIRHYKFTRLLKNLSSKPDASLAQNIERARKLIGLKRSPDILIAPKNIGPLVNGIRNPLVILPKDFAEDYSSDEQLYALCHEFSHIKRGDVIWAFGLLLVRAMHWYNPVVHYAAKRFRVDLEAACDAHVLAKLGHDADSHGYALTLLMSEQTQWDTSSKNKVMPALSLALSHAPKGKSS